MYRQTDWTCVCATSPRKREGRRSRGKFHSRRVLISVKEEREEKGTGCSAGLEKRERERRRANQYSSYELERNTSQQQLRFACISVADFYINKRDRIVSMPNEREISRRTSNSFFSPSSFVWFFASVFYHFFLIEKKSRNGKQKSVNRCTTPSVNNKSKKKMYIEVPEMKILIYRTEISFLCEVEGDLWSCPLTRPNQIRKKKSSALQKWR